MTRNTKHNRKVTVEAEIEPPEAHEQAEKTYIRDLGSIFTLTGVKTYEDQVFKDALRRIFNSRNAAIEAFITEKLEEGLTLEEINRCSSLQMPLMPTVTVLDGKQRVEWPYEILGPEE